MGGTGRRRRKIDPAASKIGAAMVRLRWARSTQEERSEAARHAVNARWARWRARQAAEAGES